jgi:hypothetical protein
MAEDQARAALHPFVAVGELEAWIADQRWEAILGGWRFRVEQAPDAAGAGRQPGAGLPSRGRRGCWRRRGPSDPQGHGNRPLRAA